MELKVAAVAVGLSICLALCRSEDVVVDLGGREGVLSYIERDGHGYGVSFSSSSSAAPAPLMVGLTLMKGANDKGAVCLDGTPPGYHLHRGSGSGANSWLIQLEGGGWCNIVRNCVFRKTTRRGSSKHMEKELPFTGILSNKAKENPEFKLRYCDGSSFTGSGQDECFFPQNLVANIKTPMFLLNAAYDAWQVQSSLAPLSADPQGIWNDCKTNHELCNSTQIAFLQDFRNQMLEALKGFAAPGQNGLFINSCFAHCQTERQDTWFAADSPLIGNTGIADSVRDWYFDRRPVKAIDCLPMRQDVPQPCLQVMNFSEKVGIPNSGLQFQCAILVRGRPLPQKLRRWPPNYLAIKDVVGRKAEGKALSASFICRTRLFEICI